jgi:hypothetical protein
MEVKKYLEFEKRRQEEKERLDSKFKRIELEELKKAKTNVINNSTPSQVINTTIFYIEITFPAKGRGETSKAAKGEIVGNTARKVE